MLFVLFVLCLRLCFRFQRIARSSSAKVDDPIAARGRVERRRRDVLLPLSLSLNCDTATTIALPLCLAPRRTAGHAQAQRAEAKGARRRRRRRRRQAASCVQHEKKGDGEEEDDDRGAGLR